MTGNQAWFEENDSLLQSILRETQDLTHKIEDVIEKKKELEPESLEVLKLLDKKILTGTELMMLPSMPNDYIVDKLLWKDDIVILLAEEKVGKTILANQMALAMTCGQHFLGEYEIPEEQTVLYIQAEGSRYETKDRIRRMAQKVHWESEKFNHMYPSSIALDTEFGYEQLVSDIVDMELNPDVIFLDPLYMSMEGELSSDYKARKFCTNLRRMKEKFDCAIVIVHHKRRPTKDKNGRYSERSNDNEIMGSFVWKAFPSHILNLEEKKNGLRALSCETQRGGNVVKGMELELCGDPIQDDPLYFKVHGSVNHMPYIDQVKQCINTYGKKGACRKMVIEATGLSRSAVDKSFNYLLGKGVSEIEKVDPKRRPVFYRSIK